MRICLIALVLLASCQSNIAGTRFHTVPSSGVEARSEARQIQESLSEFGPMINYNEITGVINVVLMTNPPMDVVRLRLTRFNANPLPNLVRPSSGFLSRVECGIRRSCRADRLARCTFTTTISTSENQRYMRDFADRLLTSGYSAMAVNADGTEEGHLVLSIPFFDQCEQGARQLGEAWRDVSNGDQKVFNVQGRP